jgi:hypothetical protein
VLVTCQALDESTVDLRSFDIVERFFAADAERVAQLHDPLRH